MKVLLSDFINQFLFPGILKEYITIYSLEDILHFVGTRIPVSIVELQSMSPLYDIYQTTEENSAATAAEQTAIKFPIYNVSCLSKQTAVG